MTSYNPSFVLFRFLLLLLAVRSLLSTTLVPVVNEGTFFFLFDSYSRLGEFLWDLYGAAGDIIDFTTLLNQWEVTGFNPAASTKATLCTDPLIYFGGPGIADSVGSLKRTYTNLVPHDIIVFSMIYSLHGNWQTSDSFSVTVGGFSSPVWALGPYINWDPAWDPKCGSANIKTITRYALAKVFHSASSMDVLIDFNIGGSGSPAPSFGIRDVTMTFRNITTGDTEGFMTTFQGASIQNSTTCQGSYYDSGSGCQQCPPSTCQVCIGTADYQCYRPGWARYFTGTAYASCPANCNLCNGSNNNNCLLCSVGYVLDYDYTCKTSCTSPYEPVGDGKTKTCKNPCTDPEYFTNAAELCPISSNTPSSTSTPIISNNMNPLINIQKASDAILTSGMFLSVVLGVDTPVTNNLAGFIKMLPYIKFMKINYPPRLQYMLDHMDTSILSLQIGFSMPKSQENKFGRHTLPENFEKYDLSSSFFVNYFTVFTTLLEVLMVILTLTALSLLVKKYNKTYELVQKIILIFRWNFFLLIFYTNFDQIILPTSLELRTLHLKSALDNFSFFMCLMINLAAILFFGLLIYIIRDLRSLRNTVHSEKPVTNIKDKWARHQVFYKELKTKSFLQHGFMFLYLFRFCLFYLIISYLFDSTILQAILIVILNLATIFYMVITNPFKKTFSFVQNLLNEFILLIVNINLLILADFDRRGITDLKTRNIPGDFIIYMNLLFSIVANVLLIYGIARATIKAFKATKNHGKLGISAWLLVFLSASDVGELEVEVVPEPEEKDSLEDAKAGINSPSPAKVIINFPPPAKMRPLADLKSPTLPQHIALSPMNSTRIKINNESISDSFDKRNDQKSREGLITAPLKFPKLSEEGLNDLHSNRSISSAIDTPMANESLVESRAEIARAAARLRLIKRP